MRELTGQLKSREKEVAELKKQIHDSEIKKMLETQQVYVECQNAEVDLRTANLMGVQNSISTKQLKELQETVIRLRQEQEARRKELENREVELKSQVVKLRDERNAVEKQLYQAEFATTEKQSELDKYKRESMRHRDGLEAQIRDLQEKVLWFRQKVTMSAD